MSHSKWKSINGSESRLSGRVEWYEGTGLESGWWALSVSVKEISWQLVFNVSAALDLSPIFLSE